MAEMTTPEQAPVLERIKYVVFLIIAAALIAGVAVLLWRQPEPATISVIPPEPTPVPSATSLPAPTPTPGPVTVYVYGAVATPEVVVTLPYGSRVIDLVQAVGGPAENADLEQINLAQVLEDEDPVEVPARSGDRQATPAPQVRVVTPTPGEILVYVIGEVARPVNMVSLPPGSRVGEAVEAAGGYTDSADQNRVNPTQILRDGDLVYVPPQEGKGEEIEIPTPNRPSLVNVNTASLEELDALPGIGPGKAGAIIEYRTANGDFTSIDQLLDVPGIGDSTLDGMREQISLTD
ncbi:MAG: hypothetical protein GYB65_07590 [Chloroflexi bacterium]|nr:hypothetical protein [Chloroflexota bacterium]